MNQKYVVHNGTIESFNTVSVWGSVCLDDGRKFRFHATEFVSRRRGEPRVGERLEVVLENDTKLREVRRPDEDVKG